MPVVISDSSTLIHLARLGRLDLLRTIFGTIIIPPAVWREVVEQGQSRPGAVEIEQGVPQGWLQQREPTNDSLLRLLKQNLDDGEAEVIGLAIELQADLVLLDESEARRIAATYGLYKTGVVGLLIRARQEGRIDSLRIALDRLRNQSGFWLNDDLYTKALIAVGEQEER